jgi:hypothetical protein
MGDFFVNRLITALAALATTLTLGAAPAVLMVSPAEAANATPGCVTKTEFRAVKMGTKLGRAKEIIGATGRVSSSGDYSDGDGWKDIDFRQCGRTWSRSSVSLSFEKTETEVWVPDWYCDSSGCEDWGSYETQYSLPFVTTSKYAYWS